MALSEKQAGVRLVREADTEAVGGRAAALVARRLAENPESSIVFPTGNTPRPMYRALRNEPGLDWSRSRLFHLDEYVPPPTFGKLSGGHFSSGDFSGEPPYETFETAIRRELWDHVDGQKHFFGRYTNEPEAYEALVLERGGPDLVILGIGRNGHVAFNEPPCGPDGPTHRVTLSESTLKANFGPAALAAESRANYPAQAVTLGMRAILSARRILLLATGEGKRAIVRRAFDPSTPPEPECPASWLKRHPDILVLTDFIVFEDMSSITAEQPPDRDDWAK
jgi:glucosamine-6-phosphate deaminase